MGRDPVEDIMRGSPAPEDTKVWSREDAELAVTALHRAGWLLVRCDPCADLHATIGQCGCVDITVSHVHRPT
jgi:hypothetical protein